MMIKTSDVLKKKTLETLKDIAAVNTVENWKEKLEKLSDEVAEINKTENI